MKGQRLLNHVIDSKQAESETWCRWFCLWDNNCASINYNDTEDSDKQHLCELNDSDDKQHPKDLKKEKDFSHYGTKNPCTNSPCGENGLCQTGFGSLGYRCVCKAGYSGQACEKDINECDKSKPCHPNAKCINTPGSYECKCNAGYEGNGKQCAGPPSFTKTPKEHIFLLIGGNLTIECNASGVPKPTVEWTGSPLGPTQGRSKQQDGRLSISNAQMNDSGNYTCRASSKLGVINTTTELVVLGKGEYHKSCKEAYDDGHREDKAYSLYLESGKHQVYCHMSEIVGCGSGGFTMVMKINGTKDTYSYDSDRWTNKEAYNVGAGVAGFDEQETKLSTYWESPFSKVCLGMKVGVDLRFISIDQEAPSLYSLIADGQYRATSLGRNTWKSLINDSSLQLNCNKEGFNAFATWSKTRIGITSNEQNNCDSTDSRIGFGAGGHPDITNSCGNAAEHGGDNGDKYTKAYGYILVQ